MKRLVLVGSGFLALVAGITPSLSADLAPVYKAPTLPLVATWTGFYIGGHVGGGWGRKQFFDNFPVPDGDLDADAAVSGWLGGLQAGVNYQIDRLVLGLEGEFSWSNVRNEFSCFSFGDQVCSANSEWFATLTPRVGVTFGPALFYVKGGPAWVQDQFTDLATCAGSQPHSAEGIPADCGDTFRGNQTRVGWTVGVGIEYLFTRNWSVKLEYDHLDFGRRSVSLIDDDGRDFFTEEIVQRINVVKAGLNYKFDWSTPGAASASAGHGYASAAGAELDEPSGHVLAFAGVDVSKYSFDGYSGALIAVSKDLDTSGPRVFILGGAGIYKYFAEGSPIKATYTTGDFLAGYGFEGDNYSINLLIGGNAANHVLSEFDPENPVQGTAFGVKVRGDAWVNPTPKTLTYAEGEYSTAFQTYYTLAKVGYDITDGKQIFAGPEASVFGDERFNQWRVGAHVTQLKFGKLKLDASAGYANDSIVGAGAYGRLELNTNF